MNFSNLIFTLKYVKYVKYVKEQLAYFRLDINKL